MAKKRDPAGHGGPVLCGAKRKQGGGAPCTQVAGWGVPGVKTGPCKLHGGATATHRKAAERAKIRQGAEEARRACELFELPLDHRSPGEVLLDEVDRARAAMAWHERQIALAIEAEDDELLARRYAGWHIERAIAARVSVEITRLGIERRQVEAVEDLARQAVAVLACYTELMGWDPQSPEARAAGRQALQLLKGGGAA